MEIEMTNQRHPHAAFDRFPQLVHDLENEFGAEEIDAIVERFIEAERADFYWDGRITEMNLGEYKSLDDAEETFERVAIVGYFRGSYYVATCVVDKERRVEVLCRLRQFASIETAETAFLASS